MRRRRLLFLAFLLCFGAPALALGQENTEIAGLYESLTRAESTDAAAQWILDLSVKNPSVKGFAAAKLPPLIRSSEIGPVWLNAVRLAGQLKVAAAVPALIESLTRGPVGRGEVTMAQYANLDMDVVAKALAEIGEPSIPPVKKMLGDNDAAQRKRGAMILLKINSPQSRRVLRNHLKAESDPAIRIWIEQNLPR